MTTLQGIGNLSLTQAQLKADRQLVIEVQTKLANLGFYPGGSWIDGDLGGSNSFSWNGLIKFCTEVGSNPIASATVAMNLDIAQKLINIRQVPSVLGSATKDSVLKYLNSIQPLTTIVNTTIVDDRMDFSAFVSRTIDKSPFKEAIKNYQFNLEQRPDGTQTTSHGNSLTLVNGSVVNFDSYPDLNSLPTIDGSGLDFLSSTSSDTISQACLCVGSFVQGDDQIKAHWLGKNALSKQQFWSATKFIAVLNAVCKINKNYPGTDIGGCYIGSPSNSIFSLVKDLVRYNGGGFESNDIGGMFKRFSERSELEKWVENITKNDIDFRGFYGHNPPSIDFPKVIDPTNPKPVLSYANKTASGDNLVSAYDLVRLISMVGWHPHLVDTNHLPNADWNGLAVVARAMGHDTARYVDTALETLGLINVISKPVIFSKVGWGNSSSNPKNNSAMTYVAFVKFVDGRTSPGKFRTFALALRCQDSLNPGDFDSRDTRLAASVTEIIRRIVMEELA
jgi:hypothetical protein